MWRTFKNGNIALKADAPINPDDSCQNLTNFVVDIANWYEANYTPAAGAFEPLCYGNDYAVIPLALNIRSNGPHWYHIGPREWREYSQGKMIRLHMLDACTPEELEEE